MKTLLLAVLFFAGVLGVLCYLTLAAPALFALVFWIASVGLFVCLHLMQRRWMKPVQNRELTPQRKAVVIKFRWIILPTIAVYVVVGVLSDQLDVDEIQILRPFSRLRWALVSVPIGAILLLLLRTWLRYKAYATPFRQAAALVRDGRDVEAIELYRTRLDDLYSGAAAATYLATVLLRRREYGEALDVIETYVTGDGELARLIRYSWQHRLGREVGQWDQSETALNSMREEFPNQAITRFCDVRWLREIEKRYEDADNRMAQALDDFDAKLLEYNGGRESFEQWLNADTFEADELGWKELFGQSAETKKKYGW